MSEKFAWGAYGDAGTGLGDDEGGSLIGRAGSEFGSNADGKPISCAGGDMDTSLGGAGGGGLNPNRYGATSRLSMTARLAGGGAAAVSGAGWMPGQVALLPAPASSLSSISSTSSAAGVTNEAGVIGAAAAGSHAETCRRTVLADVSFTAPFKAISPFYRGDGHMRVMLISVSAGLMCGDEQEIGIDVQDGAWLDVTSQAFEKVHKMPDGSFARRHTRLSVGKGATLNYTPLPAIPFRDSAFKSETEVRLADHTSRFFQSEIISCGRASRGERFEYRAFESRTKIYAGPTLVYADNAAYIPGKAQMEGFCIFEGYTHFASYIMVHQNISEERAEELGEAVRSLNGGAGGLTRTGYGDYCARALSNGSEQLIGLGAELRRILGLGI